MCLSVWAARDIVYFYFFDSSSYFILPLVHLEMYDQSIPQAAEACFRKVLLKLRFKF